MSSTEDVARTRYLLPPEAYYAPEWYEREQVMFAQNWALVAYVADLPEAGSWAVGHAGPTAVLVVRQPDGSLLGSVRAGLGSEPLRPGAPGLRPCAVDTWGGVVFACLDAAAAPSLTDWLADFPTTDFIGDFPLADLVPVHRVTWDIACNWKFYVENHIDCYHLWYLHDETLGMFDHHGLTYRSTGVHWACDEALKEGADSTGRRESLPRIPGVSDAEARITRANLLFPNVPWTSGGGTSLSTYQVIPTGPESCRLDFRIRAVPGSVMSETDQAGMAKVLYVEDGFACEQMQRVVKAPRFQVGPLAQVHEQPIMTFHENVLRWLG